MRPGVTAEITTHGRPDRVHEALASVRRETHQDIEIVVVDDCGAFGTSGYGMDRPFRIVHGPRRGVGHARNRGLAAAHGRYVIFLDDDDVAMPHRIARLVRAADEQDATLCFGLTRRVVDDTAEVLGCVPTHLIATSGVVGFRDLLACAPHVNAVLVRTEALRDAGGFDAGAEHFDDWSAWLRIADGDARMWRIVDTVADWRLHEQGLSGQVLQGRAMKARLVSLFDRLEPCLSTENADAVATARAIVESSRIVTYDDYADAMALARTANEWERRGASGGPTRSAALIEARAVARRALRATGVRQG